MDNSDLKINMIRATIWVISSVAVIADSATSSAVRSSSSTDSSSSQIWRNSTSLPASLISTVQIAMPSSHSSSMQPDYAKLDDVSMINSPASLTNNSAGDVILTLSPDFAHDIAGLLSLGTCSAYDPIPSKPIIEKRQMTLSRNPCAVTRSKSGIKSIGVGSPLFKSLFNLPRVFPTLVSPLDLDVQDISSYVKLNLPSWSRVPEWVIIATAKLFYLMTWKHEMDIDGSIIVNTILHYYIAQSGDPTPTITSSVSSTAASTTNILTRTCPSNTFRDPSPTVLVRSLHVNLLRKHSS